MPQNKIWDDHKIILVNWQQKNSKNKISFVISGGGGAAFTSSHQKLISVELTLNNNFNLSLLNYECDELLSIIMI